jgi:predicted type IV restriction endonuclease
VPEEERDGHINYIVTVLLKRLYQPPNYRRYNKAIGVLECIKMEFYRRMVGPYEEEKISENGDVL